MTDEQSYIEGHRRALLGMLRHVLGALDVYDPEAGAARWVIERQDTVAVLRRICAEIGDNEWPDDLHIGDVIEKHLVRHMENSKGTDR
jgi:hypothetical protein